ncbi:secretin N-terminal domain-containing protein [Pseudomonas saliphila]|uniref:secretin N-terminal domain-containing protein n=1 Tax=Pseudomonas saliphila TaxID=2586906 RepID=UPI0015B61D5B|nr:secretin N-terminal domain-containing protein [Pseudomonas saliphila]
MSRFAGLLRRCWHLPAIWLLAGVVSAAPSTEIIPLTHGLAETLVPVVQPMLQDSERVSAYGSQLIIRAEPERIAEIRALVKDLDTKPSRLRISVASSGETAGETDGYRVNGRIGNRSGGLVMGDPREANSARIIRRETRGASDGVRQVTANEGYPVYIQSGQSLPITTRSTDAYGGIVEQSQYRDVTQGFYATVRLSGDSATISLSTNNDRVNTSDDQRIDVRHTNTQVSTRLGEWVTVGALGDIETDNDRGLGRRTTTRRHDSGTIRLKVERLD